MASTLEPLKVNRIKMRAESFAFMYGCIKTCIKELLEGNQLYIRRTFERPDGVFKYRLYSKKSWRLTAGVEIPPPSKNSAPYGDIINVWVKVDNRYMK